MYVDVRGLNELQEDQKRAEQFRYMLDEPLPATPFNQACILNR